MMASYRTGSIKATLQDVLQCKLCTNQLKVPYTFNNCLHSFCNTCVETIPKSDQNGYTGRICITCNKFTIEQEIKRNYFIENLAVLHTEDKESKPVLCQQCMTRTTEATGKCIDCKLVLCDECQFVHSQIPILKDHKLQHLCDLKTHSEVIDKLIYCNEHSNKLIEYNCETCETMCCAVCNVADHNTHHIETVSQALKRLLIDIDKNKSIIEENISKMELQICGIKKRIDETKITYLNCREELDRQLQKVVNELKEAKSVTENNLFEHEVVVLDMLQNMIQNIEHNLSIYRNLVNLFNTTIANSKCVSLLEELQCRLRPKATQYSNDEIDCLEFQINIPQFEVKQDVQVKVDQLKPLLGDITYNKHLSIVNQSGYLWTENDHICDDLTDLIGKEFVKKCEVDIPVPWCNRLSYIDNRLWLPCGDVGDIRIYSISGKYLKSINSNKSIIVVKKAINGDIICGGKKGLFVTNDKNNTWIKVDNGGISDVFVKGNNLFALKYKATCEVCAYSLNCQHDGKLANTKWLKVSSFPCGTGTNQSQKHPTNTLLVDNMSRYICCFHNSGMINILSSDGSKLYSLKMESLGPCLCGVDSFNNILLTSFSKRKFYVLGYCEQNSDTLFQKSEIYINEGKALDGVIDSCKNMWVLVKSGNYKLIKYTFLEK